MKGKSNYCRFQVSGSIARCIAALFICMLALSGRGYSLVSAEPLKKDAVSVTFERDTLLVGERVRCTLAVRHKRSTTIGFEGIDRQRLQPSELIAMKQTTSNLHDGNAETTLQLDLALFGLGRQQLPAIRVIERNSDGRVLGSLQFKPEQPLFVRALTDSTLKELRPIVPIMKPGIPLLIVLPIMVVMILLGLVAWLLQRRKVWNAVKNADPAHSALQKINQLGKKLSGGISPADGYEELSNILREFLQKRYHFSAMEQVTQEISTELQERQIAGNETIMPLLERADLIKFAESRPDIEECRISIRLAEEVIRNSGEQAQPALPVS